MIRSSNRRFLICIGVLTLVLSTLIHVGNAAPKPNVILVMTDDQGYGDLGCLGNKVIKTPAIDRFYKRSVRLTNYHVDPTCSPTRSALVTGRYSSRTGVWHTIMGRSLMHTDEYTLGELFRDNGYRTGVFGKWHLGDNYPCRPQDQGFQETLVCGGGGVTQTPDYFGNTYFDDTYVHNGKWEKFSGYCTDVFFDGALKFIEKNKSRPFFVYLPTNAAHGPFNVAKKYSEPYEKLGVPPLRAKFYGMLTNIDENMARLRKRLKRLGLEENTILIFTTDNGTAGGMLRARRGKRKRKTNREAKPPAGKLTELQRQIRFGFNAGMRGIKGSEYDGGHRVPFFIRWPKGRIGGGRDVNSISAHIDVFPTLADFCGLKVPKRLHIDGLSLANPLRGIVEETWPKRTLFVHSQRVEFPQKWRKAAVMTDRWRFVVNGKRRELFDMKADPGQKTDVKDKHPDVAKTLSAAYEKWYASIGTRFKDYVRITIGSPHDNPGRLTCHDWHTNDRPVPWHQGHIRNDLQANGYWAIHVDRKGTYEFTLRTRPARLKAQIPRGTARIKVGSIERSKKIADGDTAVTFRMELQPGDARLQTWFENQSGRSRGAYFVHARFVK
jgi:arylsulfatase A-like enzyme